MVALAWVFKKHGFWIKEDQFYESQKLRMTKSPVTKSPMTKSPMTKSPTTESPMTKSPDAIGVGPNIRQTRKCVLYYVRLRAQLY